MPFRCKFFFIWIHIFGLAALFQNCPWKKNFHTQTQWKLSMEGNLVFSVEKKMCRESESNNSKGVWIEWNWICSLCPRGAGTIWTIYLYKLRFNWKLCISTTSFHLLHFLNVQFIPLISFHTSFKSYVEHCKLFVWDECRVFGLIDLIHRPPWAQCPL